MELVGQVKTRFDDLLLELAREHAQEVAQLRSILANFQENGESSKVGSQVQGISPSLAPSPTIASPKDEAQPISISGTLTNASDVPAKEESIEDHSIQNLSLTEFSLHPSWIKAPSKGLWGHELDWQMIRQSSRGLEDSEGNEENARARCVTSPSNRWRLTWDCVGAAFVCYEMMAIPVQLSFQPRENAYITATSWTISIFWTIDMILCAFFTGFYKQGRLIITRHAIFRNYLRGWFWIDLCVVVPDWVMKYFGQMSNVAGLGRVLRTARILRLLRMVRAAKMRKIFMAIYDSIDSEYAFAVIGLMKSVLAIFTLNHVTACVWYALGRFCEDHFPMNWVQDSGQTPVYERDFLWRYTTSLHWAITQFTPASMDVSATNSLERVFSIVVLFIAMVSISSLIGSVTTAMTAIRSASSDNMKQMWMLRRYFRRKHISFQLQDRVFKYLDYQQHLKQQSKTIPAEDVKLLAQIPPELEKQLANEMNAQYFREHPLFYHLDEQVCQVMFRICHSAIDALKFAVDDVAFYCDEEAQYMYFVRSGRFEYQLIDGHIQSNRLGPKTWASEPVLFTGWRHRGSLIAMEHSDILVMHPAKFQNICQSHPRPWYFAARYATKFVQCLNKSERVNARLLDVFCQFEELLPVKQFDTLSKDLLNHPLSKDVHPDVKARLSAMTALGPQSTPQPMSSEEQGKENKIQSTSRAASQSDNSTSV